MKAAVYRQYGHPDVVHVEEVAAPEPGDHEVRVRIRAATVSSTDGTARRGDALIERMAFGLFKPKNPILGTEFAGEVDAVGGGATRFQVGDAVWGASGANFGAHAEYICLPEDGALALKPESVSFEEAAAICEGGLTALPFLRDEGNIQAGQKVLINGASGAVGTSAVQLAKQFGAEVIGVCSTRNMDLVKSLGASRVIDYTQEDFTQTGDTYDLIFDTVGKSSFSQCKISLAPDGIYLNPVLGMDIVLRMLWTSKVGSKKARIAFTGLRSPEEKRKDLDFFRELVEAGQLRGVVQKSFALGRIVDAYRLVDTGHKAGSVVVMP